MTGYVCPVCGFDDLHEPPRLSGAGGSYEICLSCGFEYGFTDESEGFTYRQWRERWVAAGMPWASRGNPRPARWDPKAQLDEFLANGDTSEDDVYRGV